MEYLVANNKRPELSLRPLSLLCRIESAELEVKLGADLDSTWDVRAGDLTEVTIAQARVDTAEIGVVECVEVFSA